jgi:hypothetical protein
MSLTIIQNTTGFINAPVAATDTGWSIDGQYAIHGSCVSGKIISLTDFGLVVGTDYVFTYTVDSYSSGGVKILAGDNNGTNRTANGTYTQTLTQSSDTTLSFFSDGSLRISLLKFYDLLLGPQSAQVISFFDKANKWTADYEYENDTMAKFIDSFVSWKQGELWVHNTNPIQNNLYGDQYSSKLTIIVNPEYQKEKLYYNFRLDAVGKWYMPAISTPDSNQFPNGMLSQLKKNNFKLIDNKLWSSILNDVNDPNFATISDPTQRRLDALFGGRKMQGGWLIVDLECQDTQYHEISSVESYYITTERSI